NSSTFDVTITAADDASFSYASATYCTSDVDPTPTITGEAGGTFTAPAGLIINAGTGVIDVSASTVGGPYTVTYTTTAPCANSSTFDVTITAADDASFSYASVTYCTSDVDPTPTITGEAGGTFTAPAGLIINAGTGVIDVSASTVGGPYTVTYTTTAPCANSSTFDVTITAADDASFSYASATYCTSDVDPTPTITGEAGGTFTAPAGLIINAGTGVIDVSASTVGGPYTVTYTTTAPCANSSTFDVTITAVDDASFSYASATYCTSDVDPTPTITGEAGGTFTAPAGLIINAGTGVIDVSASTVGGPYTVTYTTTAPCANSSTFDVTITAADDASFTTSDFCEASVNVISAVAIPGGTYVIAGQTGSGLVTINGSTGVLSNYVAGDQITIEYTTPAGGCQNSSTQVINVTAQDDASFTSVDFCESSVNAISAVAVPGGTFTIAIQSGTATIDGTTGILSGYAAGDQITIEYTTPAGSCQNSSTQIVNVVPTDNGVFTMTASCDGGTVNLAGLAGGVFSFLNAPTDGAIIDPATGTVSGGTSGTNYDVEFITNGMCPVTTSQSVVALDLDDASFILTPTCDGATATVLGTVGGSFAFSTAPVDAAIIDASTGGISGGDYNSSYAVVYNTGGACPASSIENVIVDDCSVPLSIVIPTAFTPGSDGVNGTWEIQDLDNNYPDNSVIVYNRWGSVVFEYTSSAANPYSLNEWDGTFKGQELPVASYYYIITGNDGSDDSFKGTVTIVRN
ncbi:MAG: gliding motility-associated-like protein, partial [Crocinitomicaceae bacterium]